MAAHDARAGITTRSGRTLPVIKTTIPNPTQAETVELARIRDAFARLFDETYDPITDLIMGLYTKGADRTINNYLRDPIQNRVRMSQRLAIPRWMLSRQENEFGVRGTDWLQRVRIWFHDPNWVPTVGFVVRGLRNILRRAPSTKIPITLYRGVSSKMRALLDNPFFIERGIMSTTANTKIVTRNFLHNEPCCLMILRIPAGVRVLSIASQSQYEHEDEFSTGSPCFWNAQVLSDPPNYVSLPSTPFIGRYDLPRIEYDGRTYDFSLLASQLATEKEEEESKEEFETDPTYVLPSQMEEAEEEEEELTLDELAELEEEARQLTRMRRHGLSPLVRYHL